jgi:nitrite reductase (NADH) large subunit
LQNNKKLFYGEVFGLDVVIIGNSATGIMASRTVAKLAPAVSTTLIGEEGNTSYSRARIPEILAGSSVFEQIIYQKEELYRQKGIKQVHGKVTRIMPDVRRLVLASGEEISYDRLLVATGAAPVMPDLPGRNLAGIFGFRSYSDALAVSSAATDCTRAVVLGGGLVGLKAAYALKKRGLSRVAVVVKSPYLMSKQLDGEAASMVEKVFRAMGVDFHFGTDAAAFLPAPDGGRVGAVLLEDGTEIPAQMVIAGKGVRPRAGLVAEAGGQVGRGILVNPFFRTSLPDLYAAGDCAEVTDVQTGLRAPSGLWPLAVEQGRYAAMNMIGLARAYPSPLTVQNAVRFGALSLIAAGRRDAGNQVVVRRREPVPGVLKKFFLVEDQLRGYILVNDLTGAGLFTALVRSGRRTPGLAAVLAEDSLPLNTFVPRVLTGVR